MKFKSMRVSRIGKGLRFAAVLLGCIWIFAFELAGAQSLQIINMAIPARSFQMVIYPIAQQKGYMKEEGIDQRVIFIAPTTSIQAMLGGDVHFTGAGSSALVSIDKTQNILWRLNNGELDNVNPKVIVLMAGTNNIGNRPPEGSSDKRVDDITRGIKAILEVCRRKAPRATILLMGIFPRNDSIAVMPIINEINRRIAKFADGKRIRYININNQLADTDGKLFEGMTNDGLHLDLKGYQVWADALKPIFKKLLGPPGKEDHAPPPTGDPSAKNRPKANL